MSREHAHAYAEADHLEPCRHGHCFCATVAGGACVDEVLTAHEAAEPSCPECEHHQEPAELAQLTDEEVEAVAICKLRGVWPPEPGSRWELTPAGRAVVDAGRFLRGRRFRGGTK